MCIGSLVVCSYWYVGVPTSINTKDAAWYGWSKRMMYERSGMFHVKHWYEFTSIDEWVVAIAAVVGLLVDRCTSDAAWWCGAV